MHKKAVLVLTLLFAVGLVSATDYSFSDSPEVVTFGSGSVNVDVSCTGTPNSCSPGPSNEDYVLEACGDSITHLESDADTSMSINVEVPQDFTCGHGDNTLFLEDGDGNVLTSDGILNVEADSMPAHKGKSLIVQLNRYDNINLGGRKEVNSLEHFFLTDSCIHLSCSDQVEILLIESDDDYGDGGDVDWIAANSAGPGTSVRTKSDTLRELTGSIKYHFRQMSKSSGDPECYDDDPSTGNACEVAELDFRSGNPENIKDPSDYDTIPASPLHRSGGDYFPQGEIMVGYEPLHFDSGSTKGGDGPFLFVCREGATMDGEDGTTPLVLDVDDSDRSELYKCDTKGDGTEWRDFTANDWDLVEECEDGLDNDGDGTADYPNDPECGSTGDNSEATEPPGTTCDPHLTKMADGSLVANWSTTSPDTVCDADKKYADTGWSDNSPEAFTCKPTDPSKPSESDQQNFCDSLGSDHLHNSDNSGEAVEFYPSKDYLENQAPGSSADTGETWTTRFVTSSGWTSGMQSLHQAEMKYDGGVGDNNCESCHDVTVWRDRNLTDTDGDTDSVYDSGDYIDSWLRANPGSEHSQVADSDFSGGFAGDCRSSGQNWQKTFISGVGEKWACSGAIPWDQQVFFPSTSHTGNEAKVGFFIMPYNVKDDTSPTTPNSYYDAMEEAGNTGGTPEDINAACWKGESGDKPSFDSSNRNQTWFAMQLTDIENSVTHPIPVVGKLEISSDTAYTCKWKYTDSEARDVKTEGELVKISASEFSSSVSLPGDVTVSDGLSREEMDKLVTEWRSDSVAGSYDVDGPVLAWY